METPSCEMSSERHFVVTSKRSLYVWVGVTVVSLFLLEEKLWLNNLLMKVHAVPDPQRKVSKLYYFYPRSDGTKPKAAFG